MRHAAQSPGRVQTVALIVLVAAVGLGAWGVSKMFWKRQKANPTLAQQIDALASCGLKPNEGADLAHFLKEGSEEDYQSMPWMLLLMSMGLQMELPDGEPVCDRVLTFDLEQIEDDDAYPSLLKQLVASTAGEIAVTDARGKVDYEGGRSSIEFASGGRDYAWTFEQQDDWVSEEFLGLVNSIPADLGLARRFAVLDGCDQQVVVIYADDDERRRFKRTTGIALIPF